MKNSFPKRIAIIGVPGSGKSTLALKIKRLLNIPIYHLDTLSFVKGKKQDPNEVLAIQRKLVELDSWIIEGCSFKTLDLRFKRAQIVVYLDFPRLLCLWRAFKRGFFYNQNLSSTGCVNMLNWILVKYIWSFKKEKNQLIEQAKSHYPDLIFRKLKNSVEVEDFLAEISSALSI